MENQNINGSGEKVRKVFETEFAKYFAFASVVVGIVMGVIRPIYVIQSDIALMKQDISNINTNHEAHIQDIEQHLKDDSAQIIQNQKDIIDLQKQVIVLQQKIK